MIYVNWFSVQLPSSLVELSAASFPSSQERKDFIELNTGLHKRTYRCISADAAQLLVVLSGPCPTGPNWVPRAFSLNEHPHLFSRVVENAFAETLASMGADIERSRWEILATRGVNARVPHGLVLSTGIAAKGFYVESHAQLGLTLAWKVLAAFARTLDDPTMKAIALGRPAVKRTPSTLPGVPQRGFLGTVAGFTGDGRVQIRGRDRHMAEHAVTDVTLEATAETLRAYEAESRSGADVRWAWRRIQELSFGLNPNGRRNNGVLRDRMRAVRDFVFGENDTLPLKLPSAFNGSALVSSRPFEAPLQKAQI